ncbi:MAG: ethylbenzene dehydrogenase-related protein [Bacteroidota bacterium]|nr:ethylbenzene dehydrogenase-related protein [Bacteroidota bacterium]
MKKYKLSITVILVLIVSIFILAQCTKSDQVLDVPVALNGNELFSQFTATAPVIDGAVDPAWANAQKLQITPTVPDAGNGLFTGYIGQQYPATLRSMYDDQNIYFLLEIPDATQSTNVTPWYFDPALNVAGKTGWQKEPSSRTFDGSGVLTREGWGEDKFAMLWNINKSTPKFLTQTCYASCHVFTPYLDYSQNPAVMVSNSASGNHYTNGPNEKIDMWWGRLGFISKDASLNQMDDNYQDWAGGQAITNLTGGNANGRHVDGIVPDGTKSATWPFRPNYTVSPTQGEVSNSQNLKLDGTGASVAVPIWVIPGSNTGFILVADTVSGRAKKVTQVSSSGVLTLGDASTIDPTVGTDYQRSATATGPTAPKSIAAFIGVPLIGGRADIASAAVYNGSGWVVEYKRKIKTGDVLNQDIDFTGLQDQQFGIAIWNSSNYQHGINPNLVLKFKQ